MSPQPDNRHYVRRVVLPSGKTIEVVYFDDQQLVDTEPRPEAVNETVQDLHVCATCDSDLVYPTEWDEAGTMHWEVALRCPNCEWNGSGIFQQELVERFDEQLDHGTEALVRDLKRLMHANMEEEIDRFVQALDHDLILPEDF